MPASTPHYLLFSESNRSLDFPTSANAGGRWRFVLESVDGSTQFSAADEEGEYVGDRLELLAVIRGLEALDQPSRVTLMTHSRYVSRGIRFGLSDWRENDWRWESFGEMIPVPNADLWQRVDRALRIHNVRCRAWQFQQMSELCETGSAELTDWLNPASVTEPVQPNLSQATRNSPRRSMSIARRWLELRCLLARWWRSLRPESSSARTLACS